MSRLRERMVLSLPTRYVPAYKCVKGLRVLFQDLQHDRIVLLDRQTEQSVLKDGDQLVKQEGAIKVFNVKGPHVTNVFDNRGFMGGAVVHVSVAAVVAVVIVAFATFVVIVA